MGAFPKHARLRHSKQFFEVDRLGHKLVGKYFIAQILLKNQKKGRLGITANRRYGSAVQRNYFKRRVREAYRLLPSNLSHGLWIHIKPRPLANSTSMREIQSELRNFLEERNRKKG